MSKTKKKVKNVIRKPPVKGPKVLIFDIETAPIIAHVWGLWENNVALNQIVKDWHVLSWSAKWLGAPPEEVMYMDQRHANKIEDDREILEAIWKLLDTADVVITQNGTSFDEKKLNARFLFHGFPPPSSYKRFDTKIVASKRFGFTSNKLEYMTDKFCVKYKKLKHKKYPGHEMWWECMLGNQDAWQEMEKYNKYDVLSLEELATKLMPWENTINFNLYHEDEFNTCKCGSTDLKKNGYFYTSVGKYQRYKCNKCGAESRDRKNLFSKEKRDSLQVATVR